MKSCWVNPPESVRPLGGITKLYARARRVILSIKITTSRFCSTNLIARSSTSSATLIWFSGTSSNVELTTSAFTERSISVTSSDAHLLANNQFSIWMISRNRIRNFFEQNSFPCFWWRYNKSTLSKSNWSNQINCTCWNWIFSVSKWIWRSG